MAVVGLLVLGPRRLPGALRSLGLLQRRLSSAYRSVRWELERQLEPDEENKNSHGNKINQPESAEENPPSAPRKARKTGKKGSS